ncbi:MAG TPA: TRC40/GET3/ArsA family transport-energizing ATPase [Rhodothermales bacterium]|nr:TRC40/GET3/ArsA family transport-energizing ATPase [Rhodothermales bacterium]HRR07541.1 TRC40/GET3/ArsA family transport-energizing ATPase [Rhodothermales bacterium]
MSKRILLFTGKGGVGKTTCAAATALQTALEGKKTLVLSSDPAHSLADALDVKLGPEPVLVTQNLWAQEVDLYYSMQKYWQNLRHMLLVLFKWQGVQDVAAEELASLPGMAEASTLLWLDQFYTSDDFEVIVVDSAPTGETLTLLSLPQVTQWWLTKAFPFQRSAVQLFGKAVNTFTGVPLDKGVEELDAMFGKLERVQKILANPTVTSMRIVANPERMVINEARRAYTYLQLYGYGVDAVLVNRVLPDTTDPAWGKYLSAQKKYLEEIENSFSPLPILNVPHLGEEVFGLERLQKIGTLLYKSESPTKVFFSETTYRVVNVEAGYRLEIRLPASDTEVNVQQFGDQLVIQAGHQRRNYLLPQFLGYYKMKHWQSQDGWLKVVFAE